MNRQYETVIGLEVHVELATRTKIFCGCSTEFGGEPNAHTCPVCTGMPGALPVLNRQVVEDALAVGIATDCSIHSHCKFDRKNYFYPDNPQNYQISQFYLPICYGGKIEIELEGRKKEIRIHEIHMEEDAGKLLHDVEENLSFLDFNRSGVPLIEIVSEPDMRSAKEVIAYLENLRFMIQYLGVSDCKLQEGSMRVDVNLSVRREGDEKLGVRTEMKNLNSFRAITRAIETERERQISLLESGKQVVQETRRWDEEKGCSYPMRSKEEIQDYRYFPEPDLVPLVIDSEWISSIKSRQPEFRMEKQQRYKKQYQLPEYDIDMITASRHMAEIFEQTVMLCENPKEVSNWLMRETMKLLREEGREIQQLSFSPSHFALLIQLIDSGALNRNVAKEVFKEIFLHDVNPEVYVEEHGLRTLEDENLLRKKIEEVIQKHPQSIVDYKAGKKKAMGFLVGQTMKETKGKANPTLVNQILREVLE